MRQLKGKVKETRKEKRERKQDNLKNKDLFFKVVLPTLTVIAALIAVYVYMHTRPGHQT